MSAAEVDWRRTAQRINAALALTQDPEVVLRFYEAFPELQETLRSIVGGMGTDFVLNTKDPGVVMRLYDAFPGLRPFILRLPLSPKSLLLNGRYDLMEYELSRTPSPEASRLVVVACGVDLTATKMLAERYFPKDKNWSPPYRPGTISLQRCFVRASIKGKIDILEWLLPITAAFVEGRFLPIEDLFPAFTAAGRAGQFATLRWLCENVKFPLGWTDNHFDWVFKVINSYLARVYPNPAKEREAADLATWLASHDAKAFADRFRPVKFGPAPASSFLYYACGTGSLVYVQAVATAFHITREATPNFAYLATEAQIASTGSVPLAEWIAANFGLRGEAHTIAAAFVAACQGNHRKMAEWLEKRAPASAETVQKAAESACIYGAVDVLDWLIQRADITFDFAGCLLTAAENSDSAAGLRWLLRMIEQGGAAPASERDALSLLRSEAGEALSLAITNDRRDVVHFILRDLRVVPKEEGALEFFAMALWPRDSGMEATLVNLDLALEIAERANLRYYILNPESTDRMRKLFLESGKYHVDYSDLDLVTRFVEQLALTEGFFTSDEKARIGHASQFRAEDEGQEDLRGDVSLWRYLVFGS